MQLFIGDAAGYVVDQTRFTALSIVDIPPSGHADLDVAARLDDDAESYGWSNESYLCETPWRNEAWRIEQGRYLLRVRLFTLGEGYSKLFRLYNEGPREKFCLVPAFPHDRVAHEINATR